MKLPKNAEGLLIFDEFKGQTTSAVNDLLKKNDIIAIHVPNNHTNLFQYFDSSMNKSAKCFIAAKYQDWYAEKFIQQLNRGVAAHDVKVDVKLSIMKPLHAKWIIEMYHHPQRSKQIVISGFRKAHVTEAVSEADQLAQLCENPFTEVFMVTNWKRFWLILSTVAILHYGQFHLYLWGRKTSIFVFILLFFIVN